MDSRLCGSEVQGLKDVGSDNTAEALFGNKEFCCELCNFYCNNNIVMDAHLNGKKHRRKEAKKGEIESNNPRKDEGAKKQLWCEICNVRCNDGVIMETHVNGKKHKSKAENRVFPCAVCEVDLNSEVDLKCHVNGKKHKSKAGYGKGLVEDEGNDGKQQEAKAEENGNRKKGLWWCATCEIEMDSEVSMKIHVNGKKHKAKEDRNKKSLIEEKVNVGDGGVQLMARESECEDDEGIHGQVRNGQALIEEKNKNDGKKYGAKAENETVNGIWCVICEVELNNEIIMTTHLNGKQHKATVARLKGKKEVQDA